MTFSPKYNKLIGKRILVLGGTSGIGFSVAEGCLEHGANVVISGTSNENIQRSIDLLHASYPSAGPQQISGYPCDLANIPNLETNVKGLLEKATAAGKLNHIAFTAGDIPAVLPITDISVTDIPPAMSIRLYGALMVAKFIPTFMEISSGSSFTLTGGATVDKPRPGWSLMVAVGGALQALTRALTIDLQPIRVNLVSPGFVYTGRFGRVVDSPEKLESFLVSARKSTTTGEVGRPEDIAEAYLYSMKDHSIAGEVIRSNGGKLLV